MQNTVTGKFRQLYNIQKNCTLSDLFSRLGSHSVVVLLKDKIRLIIHSTFAIFAELIRKRYPIRRIR